MSIIKLLVAANPELINIPDSENNYPIHKAVLYNRINIIKVLLGTLKRKKQPIYEHLNDSGGTAVTLAAELGNLEMLSYLVENMQWNVRQVPSIDRELLNEKIMYVYKVGPLLEKILLLTVSKSFCTKCYTPCIKLKPWLLIPISISIKENNTQARDWFLQKFNLTDENLDRPLVERCLAEFKDQSIKHEFYNILFLLHSEVSTDNNRHKSQTILNPRWQIIYHDGFYEIFLNHKDLFENIVDVYLDKITLVQAETLFNARKKVYAD